MGQVDLDELDKRLLDGFQRDFPLSPHPFREIAAQLGVDEEMVMGRLRVLQDAGLVSRVGAIVAPQRAGWSTLAAMAVPLSRLNEVAELISAYPEVNHNYEREHRLNIWFVVTGPDKIRVAEVLREIETRAGIAVLDLPMLEAYRLDLGFPLQWH